MVPKKYLEAFFRSPREGDPSGTSRAVLFVLRRDLEKLYGPENGPDGDLLVSPILGAIGMMTGIDLLTKMTNGKTGKELSGHKDFVGFLIKYGKQSPEYAEALYQYRCAQTHAYGFSSFSRKGAKFTFGLDDRIPTNQQAIWRHPRNHFEVNYWNLKLLFRRCVANLEIELSDANVSTELKKNFQHSLNEIGFMDVT